MIPQLFIEGFDVAILPEVFTLGDKRLHSKPVKSHTQCSRHGIWPTLAPNVLLGDTLEDDDLEQLLESRSMAEQGW